MMFSAFKNDDKDAETFRGEELLTSVDKLQTQINQQRRSRAELEATIERLSQSFRDILAVLEKSRPSRNAKKTSPPLGKRFKETRIRLDSGYNAYAVVVKERVHPRRDPAEDKAVRMMLDAMITAYSQLIREQIKRRYHAEVALRAMRKEEADLRVLVNSKNHQLQEAKARQRFEFRKSMRLSSSVLSPHSSAQIFHQGYLCRKCGVSEEWLPEYYVLYYDHTLRIWQDRSEVVVMPARRTLQLTDASVSPRVLLYGEEQPLLIHLRAEDEDFLLQAATEEQRDVWIGKFRVACVQASDLRRLTKRSSSVFTFSPAESGSSTPRQGSPRSRRSTMRMSSSWSSNDINKAWSRFALDP